MTHGDMNNPVSMSPQATQVHATPDLYLHTIEQRLLGPTRWDTVELHSTLNDTWGVWQHGQYQSVRGMWHESSRRANFERTHTFPYEEALRRAREVLANPHAKPFLVHGIVNASPVRTGPNLLAGHVLCPDWAEGKYYAGDFARHPLNADGTWWDRDSDPNRMKSPYLCSFEDAVERAIAYVKKANINGMTIYNTGVALLEVR